MDNQKSLNWKLITPEKFEKLIFFLLDDMGFKSLEWRKGGEGVTTTDGGRDLEASYVKIEPDDSITVEKWWVEVKYRSQTLEKNTVQNLALNATGRKDISVFAIVTNNVISNNTLDWIKEFQNNSVIPRIVVWQKHDLERVLRKHSKTLAMFFPGALSLPEKFDSMKDRFWDELRYPRIEELEELWINFSKFNWSGEYLLPVITAEAVIGKIGLRKWGFKIADKLLLETLHLGLANMPFLGMRFQEYGLTPLPLQKGLEYLLQIALVRLELDDVVSLLIDLYQNTNIENNPPPEFVNYIVEPIISGIYRDLALNCAKDCQRFFPSVSEIVTEESSYFHQFSANETHNFDNGEPFVLISTNTIECKLNLIPIGKFCPVNDEIPDNVMSDEKLRYFLGNIKKILLERVKE